MINSKSIFIKEKEKDKNEYKKGEIKKNHLFQ